MLVRLRVSIISVSLWFCISSMGCLSCWSISSVLYLMALSSLGDICVGMWAFLLGVIFLDVCGWVVVVFLFAGVSFVFGVTKRCSMEPCFICFGLGGVEIMIGGIFMGPLK